MEYIKSKLPHGLFEEHVAPHLAFKPTPTAKIIQESIKSAIIFGYAEIKTAIAGLLGDTPEEIEETRQMYLQDWSLVPQYAVQDLQEFINSDKLWGDVFHLQDSHCEIQSFAVWGSILTKDWVIE